MATVKEATESAMKFAVEALGENRAVDMRLEEVDSWKIDGKDFWVITLSMRDVSAPGVMDLARAIGSLKGNREYKIFNVLKSTGEVTSMKIREFANA